MALLGPWRGDTLILFTTDHSYDFPCATGDRGSLPPPRSHACRCRATCRSCGLPTSVRGAPKSQPRNCGAERTASWSIGRAWPAGLTGTCSGHATPGRPVTSSGVSLFRAVREQLGLRLEGRRGPVDVLVVERVEQPGRD